MKYFLSALLVFSLLCGLIYVSAQQIVRTSANDPQIELAEDTAAAFSNGTQTVQTLSVRNKTDISKSLSTYLIVYDKTGILLFSSATLHDKTPEIPKGVFDEVKNKGEIRFTWQPEEDVRSAVVLTSYSGKQTGFILVGRSLREVEKREEMLLLQILTGWILGIIIISFPFLLKKVKIKF